MFVFMGYEYIYIANQVIQLMNRRKMKEMTNFWIDNMKY